jgi:hypothetical protein
MQDLLDKLNEFGKLDRIAFMDYLDNIPDIDCVELQRECRNFDSDRFRQTLIDPHASHDHLTRTFEGLSDVSDHRVFTSVDIPFYVNGYRIHPLVYCLKYYPRDSHWTWLLRHGCTVAGLDSETGDTVLHLLLRDSSLMDQFLSLLSYETRDSDVYRMGTCPITRQNELDKVVVQEDPPWNVMDRDDYSDCSSDSDSDSDSDNNRSNRGEPSDNIECEDEDGVFGRYLPRQFITNIVRCLRGQLRINVQSHTDNTTPYYALAIYHANGLKFLTDMRMELSEERFPCCTKELLRNLAMNGQTHTVIEHLRQLSHSRKGSTNMFDFSRDDILWLFQHDKENTNKMLRCFLGGPLGLVNAPPRNLRLLTLSDFKTLVQTHPVPDYMAVWRFLVDLESPAADNPHETLIQVLDIASEIAVCPDNKDFVLDFLDQLVDSVRSDFRTAYTDLIEDDPTRNDPLVIEFLENAQKFVDNANDENHVASIARSSGPLECILNRVHQLRTDIQRLYTIRDLQLSFRKTREEFLQRCEHRFYKFQRI